MPLAWFKALETKAGGARFSSVETLSRLGYLPSADPEGAGLPLGFVADAQSDLDFKRTRLRWKAGQSDKEPWLGFNCSACHTGAVEYGGKAFVVEGGQSLSDFQAFTTQLNEALEDTRADPAKWKRFAANVLPAGEADEDLKNSFDALLLWQRKEAEQNAAALQYGPTRIDAFGHIFNKVALLLDYENATRNPADAPVSIPFIWRAPTLESVQYNGIAKKKVVGNVDFGALGRNAGEVIGVWGDVVAHKDPGVLNGFASSVEVRNLMGLEDTLAKLRPPAWPSSLLGEPKPGLVALGEQKFKDHCSSCHQVLKRTDTPSLIKTPLFKYAGKSPGTDPWMACNAIAYKSSSGLLAGFESDAITDGAALHDQEFLAVLLQSVVKATMLARKADIATGALRKLFGLPAYEQRITLEAVIPLPEADPRRSEAKAKQLAECLSLADAFGYTTRPLNGIWATAPYLHNGSVPNLYALMLPPDKRPQRFYVGTRLYDPETMGFSTSKDAPGNRFEFVARDEKGPIDGNSNAGHDYNNAGLTDDIRFAIIEFLKTQ